MLEVYDPFTDTSKYQKRYHLFIWSLCLLTSILIFPNVGYNSDQTCWIKESLWRLVFIVPLSIYLAIALISIFYIIVRTKRKFKTDTKRFKTLIRMILFSIVFVTFWIGFYFIFFLFQFFFFILFFSIFFIFVFFDPFFLEYFFIESQN